MAAFPDALDLCHVNGSACIVFQCAAHVSSVYHALEGIVHGHTLEERLRLLAERLMVAMEMGYPTYFTGLEEVRYMHRPLVAPYKALANSV